MAIVFHVTVKAGCKEDLFSEEEGLWRVKIRERAVDGKANAYLIELLAKALTISKSSIRHTKGFTNPNKTFELPFDRVDELKDKLLGNKE